VTRATRRAARPWRAAWAPRHLGQARGGSEPICAGKLRSDDAPVFEVLARFFAHALLRGPISYCTKASVSSDCAPIELLRVCFSPLQFARHGPVAVRGASRASAHASRARTAPSGAPDPCPSGARVGSTSPTGSCSRSATVPVTSSANTVFAHAGIGATRTVTTSLEPSSTQLAARLVCASRSEPPSNPTPLILSFTCLPPLLTPSSPTPHPLSPPSRGASPPGSRPPRRPPAPPTARETRRPLSSSRPGRAKSRPRSGSLRPRR